MGDIFIIFIYQSEIIIIKNKIIVDKKKVIQIYILTSNIMTTNWKSKDVEYKNLLV